MRNRLDCAKLTQRNERDNQMSDKNYYKTKLLNVDAWHDGDGWTWNNWHTIEDGIYLHETVMQSARKLLRFCRDNLRILSNESKGKLSVEDDGYNVMILVRGTHEPLFAFCYGEYLDY